MNDIRVLINSMEEEEIRIATLRDGILYDYDVEFIHNEKIKGNIYKATVVKVDPSLQAAFVDFGEVRNGFLPLAELSKTHATDSPEQIQHLLHKGQEIMIQIIREHLGNKGAMASAQVSLAGRYLVLTPGNPIKGISRKIEGSDERKEFKKMVDQLELPEGIGVIVRTASLGVSIDDFQKDLHYLLDVYSEIQDRYRNQSKPGLVWREDDLVIRTLRDGFVPETSEILIDDLDTFKRAQVFMKRIMPQYLPVLKHYVAKKPIFSKYQTEEQIEKIYGRSVVLPSGGAIVIDQTEALVAVDVNSGKTVGENQEDTAYKVNLEAAAEVARQLRLRDLAGLIAIDFIDMKKESSIKGVQSKLIEHLKDDKARMEVGKINRFGVLIMTRQRIRPSLQHINHESCSYCHGTGKVKTIEALALDIFRKINSLIMKDASLSKVMVHTHPEIAIHLLNSRKEELFILEQKNLVKIIINSDLTLPYGSSAITEESRDRGRAPRVLEVQNLEENVTPTSEESKHTKRPSKSRSSVGKNQRDSQRAAINERDRLRQLFKDPEPKASVPEVKNVGLIETLKLLVKKPKKKEIKPIEPDSNNTDLS